MVLVDKVIRLFCAYFLFSPRLTTVYNGLRTLFYLNMTFFYHLQPTFNGLHRLMQILKDKNKSRSFIEMACKPL